MDARSASPLSTGDLKTLTGAELSDRLRADGYRVTNQRLAVYAAVAASSDHPTPEQVYERVRESHRGISLNTVYEVLETLTRLGALRRGDVGAGPRRYDANTEPHHHLVCRSCGIQTDLQCAEECLPCQPSRLDGGFVVEEAQITFFGLCSSCVAQNREN